MTALVEPLPATRARVRPLRVEIISSHELIRSGLTALLRQSSDPPVLVAPTSDCDVAVYDLVSCTGDPQEELLRVAATRGVVVPLVAADQEDLIRTARSAGFVDVVTMSTITDELLGILERAACRSVDKDRVPAQRVSLAPREREIVTLIARGRSNLEIAEELYLSVNSVKTYIRTAYRKMGVTSRSQAVLWAVERHLV